MKLKRLFWASIPFFFLISCSSNNGLIPGQQSAIQKNIYSEYMRIADEYFNLKKFDKALIYYKECLSFSEYHKAATYKLAKTYVMQKNYKEAIPLFKELLLDDSNNQSLIESLAYCYAMSSEKNKAEELYLNLINDYGNQSSYYENLIILYIQDKKREQSENLLTQLKEKFPDCSNIQKLESEIEKLE